MDSLMNAIMGQEPYDFILRDIRLVNLITGEIYFSEIGIKDGRIGHVSQPDEPPLVGLEEYCGGGKFAIPGLIDTHVHIESSMMTPENMAAVLLPRGTTTIACDPHEIANVLGVAGVRYLIEVSRDIPLQVHVMAPSCIPSSEYVETSGAEFDSSEIDTLMQLDSVIGLGEVMDYLGVIHGEGRMNRILYTARKHTRFLQGHAPTLTGPALSTYIAAGIKSCHETSFEDEARYKLRAGMTLECRQSSISHDIEALAPVLRELGYPGTATLCTDDRSADDLFHEGHIDHAIRTAIAHGIPPIEAIRMATCNAARLLDVEDVGLLASGRLANIALLDSLEEFNIDEVFVNGVLVAAGGELIEPIPLKKNQFLNQNTVSLAFPPSEADFMVKCDSLTATVNCIVYDKKVPLITHLEQIVLPAMDGCLYIDDHPELAVLSVFERHGKNGNKAACIVKDLGLTKGAIASTVSHDCHNLVVVGKNSRDMMLAAAILQECGGGLVCVVDGKVLSLIQLPIAGLMSELPVEQLEPQISRFKATVREMGLYSNCPIIQIATFSLAVIPSIRLTDKGLLDVNTQQFLPLFVGE